MTTPFSCPIQTMDQEVITLAHGSGGKETNALIQRLFLPAFANEYLNKRHDGAFLSLPSHRIVFTTDSYVVQPLFFPGGDIGKLAVTGTMNDLSMCGAKPAFFSCSFILEEGFNQKDVHTIVSSMSKEASLHNVQFVTGDTKVIERQSGKNLFINTSGIGISLVDEAIDPYHIQQNDFIIISGDIGRHGMAVMAEREHFSFPSPLLSDCAPLAPIVERLLQEGIEVHCMRDLTRGGLATALVELAETARKEFTIFEESIPVSEAVQSACEILGFDPLYVANEGRFVAFVNEKDCERTLQLIKAFPEGQEARCIGKVTSQSASFRVKMKNSFGSHRDLSQLMGDQLPRIC